MKFMVLPKMSTIKPPRVSIYTTHDGICQNLLAQKFDQKVPNLVWASDFTYVKDSLTLGGNAVLWRSSPADFAYPAARDVCENTMTGERDIFVKKCPEHLDNVCLQV